MIYSFGARNFFSFHEGMKVSLELNSKVPRSLSGGLKASTVLGIKGPNASGKSNVLKCISFLVSFISDSFSWEPRFGLRFDPFFKSEEDSEFYLDFDVEGVRYIYELVANHNFVVREALYKKVLRKTRLFERRKNELVYRVSELEELDYVEMKDNSSLISTAVMYKFKNGFLDFESIVKRLSNVRGNVYSGDVISNRFINVSWASKYYRDNPDAFVFVKDIVKKSDLGISDIEIHESINSNGDKEFFPVFMHNTDCGPSENRWLTAWDESRGTIALYNSLCMYWDVLQTGGLLLLDEFDVHCHSMLLPRLVGLFLRKETNPHNAQFMFTAHSTEIMDVLGKYRTLLVAKEKSESYCYRLDEIPGDLIRNDRSLSALYREGKIGGIPHYDD
ncbi:TPA: ATP-binding protein [Pseudomonas aeruginosa]|uniref:AAA family ATPase n=1 Tax=Pseudomonas aeruginosa TaxID=287 RepID=UPI00106DAE27|nr:ATP-binding protein [Pseudomonas aeruginosa]MDU0595269.1 ATP-binding protein [Pseudomonas aeruginosa]MDY1269301.1 ATP-binding protein [Pseudomonas aeruginosa]HBO3797513.1 ATP-binding protein [Pseudomonas aeruginosa]HBP0513633.1 ATP-binding protein [Pseudomonas aeruginosa]